MYFKWAKIWTKKTSKGWANCNICYRICPTNKHSKQSFLLFSTWLLDSTASINHHILAMSKTQKSIVSAAAKKEKLKKLFRPKNHRTWENWPQQEVPTTPECKLGCFGTTFPHPGKPRKSLLRKIYDLIFGEGTNYFCCWSAAEHLTALSIKFYCFGKLCQHNVDDCGYYWEEEGEG